MAAMGSQVAQDIGRMKDAPKGGPRGTTPAMRMEAVRVYVHTGAATTAARTVGVTETMVRYWQRQGWWQEALDELSIRERATLGHEIDCALRESLAAVRDRLAHGDVRYTRGRYVRVPVDAHTAAFIASMFFDKLRIMSNMPTKITKIDHEISDLATQLRNLVNDTDTGRTYSSVADQRHQNGTEAYSGVADSTTPVVGELPTNGCNQPPSGCNQPPTTGTFADLL